MDSSFLLGITTFTYLFSLVLYLLIFLFKLEKVGRAATFFTLFAFLVQTAGILLRWQESYQLGYGHAPITNMYESVVFFSWSIIAMYLFVEYKFKSRLFGTFIVPFAFLAMAYGSFSDDLSKTINPLVPALQSNWLISHVVTCFLGYASFALAAGLGVMYLLKYKDEAADNNNKSSVIGSLPETGILEDITHKVMIFGFIWLTTGIITGAIWANSAWGTYWSWDPKETWSLISWFFYAIILHARFTRGLKGTAIAWLAMAGFLVILFTYYGVNFLLSGLHSYGSF